MASLSSHLYRSEKMKRKAQMANRASIAQDQLTIVDLRELASLDGANANLKLPHMGWNNVKLKKNLFNKSLFFKEKDDFYFVHSYYFDCFDKENIIATTNYGINFPSIIGKENIYGVQFHPEKSSEQGLELIKNFIFYDNKFKRTNNNKI